MGRHVKVSQLVAELLLSLHHWFEFDENGRRHVEEVVLSVQFLILIPQFSAPLTQLINRLLHLFALIILEALCRHGRNSLRRAIHVVAL